MVHEPGAFMISDTCHRRHASREAPDCARELVHAARYLDRCGSAVHGRWSKITTYRDIQSECVQCRLLHFVRFVQPWPCSALAEFRLAGYTWWEHLQGELLLSALGREAGA